jgi:hypothetical protein
VFSPVFLASLSQARKKLPTSTFAVGSRIRWNVNTTSSAVTGWPSCHFAPWRRVNGHDVAFGSEGTAVARPGRGSRVIGSVSTSAS